MPDAFSDIFLRFGFFFQVWKDLRFFVKCQTGAFRKKKKTPTQNAECILYGEC